MKTSPPSISDASPQMPVQRSIPIPSQSRKHTPAADAHPSRLVLPLNSDWLFHRGTWPERIDEPQFTLNGNAAEPAAHWQPVNLPHSVRLEPLNASGGRNFQGCCWYLRQLDFPTDWADRILYLHVEGAMQLAEVFLNGRQIATHACGYTPFVVDLSPFARFGHGQSNTLMLRLDNSDNPHIPPGKPQSQLDFTYFGGLYRNVRLEVLNRVHLADPVLCDRVAGGGVFVTFPAVRPDAATVQIQTDLQNESDHAAQCEVAHELIGPAGRSVARCHAAAPVEPRAFGRLVQSLNVIQPLLWHPHHPHRYALRTSVTRDGQPVDEQTLRIGIRRISFDKDHGLFINGEKFFSIGANRHQDHPYVGYALPDSAHRRDVKKLRELGFTSFRSHYPQAPAFMDACDELGMLTIVSNPGWQFVGDAAFRRQAEQNARVMMRRDRNRPSVVLWEAALNESDNATLVQSLQRAVHEEYPGDQCFTAGDREQHVRGENGWNVEYLGNAGDKPYWIREWGDLVDNWSDQQSSNRVARAWGEGPMLVQAWSHLRRLNDLHRGHMGSDSGPAARRLCGACLWAGIDSYRGYHHQPFYGGPLDLFRLPKFSAFFFQSQRPPDLHVPGLDDGPMVFIASFATCFSPATITVFSNCEQVRLLHGEREIAVQNPDPGYRLAHPPFTFRIGEFQAEQSTMYMTGRHETENPPVALRAEALLAGRVVATHTVRPPGVASKLLLEIDSCGIPLRADGADWLRLYARVCDAHGTLCPTADDLVEFSAEGEGVILGGHEIGANPVRAEAGIATALLKASNRAGAVVVRAHAFGLRSAEVHCQTVPPSVL